MSNRDAGSVFDGDRFVSDVLAYGDRWKLSRRAIALASGLDLASTLQVLRGVRGPSLLVACSLADLADLSLDAYRRPAAPEFSPAEAPT